MATDNVGLNGNGTRDAPWYVRFAYIFGIPAVVCVYLVWIMANRIDTTLQAVHAELTAHIVSTSSEMIQAQHEAATQSHQSETMQLLLQKVCINTARTYQEK